ncbi:hypothetical protein METBIDRAFT_223494 [Metschnikowia bicuspidata var. bicuspidata NRRL YB-4993]|uniref:Transcription elongation factor Eaf N-terminal domain-containing protein n=1 Tax=Metschnikowia bicuspidata var. bicuspidata NRRL YB-4993 TaxID=869754 RepID=A0A1A0H4V6_9ASCO|nr:hypothetical protein METBIDRAFT_223494 [Metschnikowia bicuspidata var. bicuspidata NRRL YB-4993]OBA18958.1 hypothetical protein METBIDRAFT_223494 [Metschnikowia bicuspidata var. bicuspidata NRRL YB-4993]
MNIPDGEYDIDLLVLDSPQTADVPSLAIRYGFIPDSMDQSNLLTLFQENEVCILEAHLIERANLSELVPIIFEGVPQRQRPTQSGASSVPYSYFLSFLLAEKNGTGSLLNVQLRRLESTVRVNKSRNADKWRKSIRQWRNSPVAKAEKAAPELSLAVKQKSPHVLSVLLKRKPVNPPARKGTNGTSSSSRPSRSGPEPAVKRAAASKRPPAAKPDTEQDIISVSDFDNLESDEEDAFPIFDAPSTKRSTPPSTENSKEDPVARGEGCSGPREVELGHDNQTPGTSGEGLENNIHDHEKDDDIDMSDEFADLEDQLDEVLVDDHAKPNLIDSDSDDDSDTGAFAGTPIIIDVGEEKKTGISLKLQRVAPQSKPMSLRELYGAEKTDYLSSSEEE